MNNFVFNRTSLEGPRLISPFYSEDRRGLFLKDFEESIYQQNGIMFEVTETLLSTSYKNTLRGLHFQAHQPQDKLVSVMTGKVLDVIVDLRWDSSTFGHYETFDLSDQNKQILYVPRGFAHGFYVISDMAVVLYKCQGAYDKDSDTGINWADQDLEIEWHNKTMPIVSERDQKLMSFKQFIDAFGGLDS